MKKIFLLTLLYFFCPHYIYSQTTLSVGDIGVVYYSSINSTNPDEFGLITYVDLAPSTLIYVTDEFVNTNNTFADNADGHVLYTVNSLISAGTFIEWTSNNGTSGDGTWTVHAGTNISFSSSGDQLTIYQDADGPGGTAPENNPNIIFTLNGASNDKSPSCTSSDANHTHVAGVLTAVAAGVGDGAGTFLALGIGAGCQDENDHLYYNGTLDFSGSDINTAKATINDPDNWSGSGSTNTVPPGGFNTAVSAMKTAGMLTLSSAGDPEILIANNANDQEIADESATINTTLGTDYGSLCHAGTANSSNTYKVSNTGTADLTFGADALSISNTTDFSITTDITNSSTLAASNDITFTIQFDPQSSGTKTCTVTVNSDDADEGVYNFAIQGVGLNPTITVAATNSSVSEAGGTALEYTFTRDCTSGQLDVNFSIEGTAEDADYTVGGAGLVSGSYNTTNNTGDVRFADGSSTAVITVTPADDSLIEAAETVLVKIDNP